MTSSFDLSELNLTTEPEVIEPEAYVAPYGDTNLPIDKAIYEEQLVDGKFKNGDSEDRIPVRFTGAISKKNNQTYLAAEFAIEVSDATINGKNTGKRFVYGRVDTIPERLKFDKVKAGRENANTYMDMLIAHGYSGRLASNEDYRNALIALVEQGARARASVDKDAYCNPKSTDYAGCGASVRGEGSFLGVPTESGSSNEDIGIRTVCPGQHADGQHPILLARNIVKRFYPIKK